MSLDLHLWAPAANESHVPTRLDEAIARVAALLGRPREVVPADESACDPFVTAYWYRTGIDGNVLTLDDEGGGLYLFARRCGRESARGDSSQGWQIERSRNGRPDERGLFTLDAALPEALRFLCWARGRAS